MHSSACLRGLATSTTALALGVGACTTPLEVTSASERQLALIEALDAAVSDLDDGLRELHSQNSALIRREGRILIAREAIDSALAERSEEAEGSESVSAEDLFDTYRSAIEPWIDGAFRGPEVEAWIHRLEEKLRAAESPIERDSIALELQDARLEAAELAAKPPDVAMVEGDILAELSGELEAMERARRDLAVLRGQLALMRVLHERVDEWLRLDLTLTGERIDELAALLDEQTRAERPEPTP